MSFQRSGGIKRSLLTKFQKDNFLYSYNIHSMYTKDIQKAPMTSRESPSRYFFNTNFNPNFITKSIASNNILRKVPTTGGFSMGLDIIGAEANTIDEDPNNILSKIAQEIRIQKGVSALIKATTISLYILAIRKSDKKILRAVLFIPFPYVTPEGSDAYDRTKSFWENFTNKFETIKFDNYDYKDLFHIFAIGFGPRYLNPDDPVGKYFDLFDRITTYEFHPAEKRAVYNVFGESTFFAMMAERFWRNENWNVWYPSYSGYHNVYLWSKTKIIYKTLGFELSEPRLPSFYPPNSFSQGTVIQAFGTNHHSFAWRYVDGVLPVPSPPIPPQISHPATAGVKRKITVVSSTEFPIEYYAPVNRNNIKEIFVKDMFGMLILEIIGASEQRLNDQDTTFTTAFEVIFNGTKPLYTKKMSASRTNSQLFTTRSSDNNLTFEVRAQNRHGDPYPYPSRQNWLIIKLLVYLGSISNIYTN